MFIYDVENVGMKPVESLERFRSGPLGPAGRRRAERRLRLRGGCTWGFGVPLKATLGYGSIGVPFKGVLVYKRIPLRLLGGSSSKV